MDVGQTATIRALERRGLLRYIGIGSVEDDYENRERRLYEITTAGIAALEATP